MTDEIKYKIKKLKRISKNYQLKRSPMKQNKDLSTIHKDDSVSSNKKNDTQNKDREELKAYIYRGLHICFCQGRDKNAKQKNYVDNWTDSIMEEVNKLLSQSIQSAYQLAIKDVEKILGKDEEYSQSGYFKEDNGEIITNDEIQGMNRLKSELRLKLQSLLKEKK